MKLNICQFVIVVFTLVNSVTSLSVKLSRNSRPQCFIVHATKGTAVSGSFEVIIGEPQSIEIVVSSRKNIQFESKYVGGVDADKDLSEGTFSFEADEDGDYSMCIGNNKDVDTDSGEKIIAFNLRSLETVEQGDYQYVGINAELEELREGLTRLIDHQSYMNQREDVHRASLDDINLKVLCWTILEAIILIAMAIWQISYIRGFFEVKRRL